MDNYTWVYATISDVAHNGIGYMYSLLCDYERYAKNYNYIPIEEFLQKWTCITYKSFGGLQIGDIVYIHDGTKYIVMENPCEDEDEGYITIEATPVLEDGIFDNTGKNNDIFQTGDLYKEPVIHEDYKWKKIKESEEPLCPILITKTNQHQN